ALWLLARTHAIRQHEAAGQCLDEITRAVREAQRAVDRPPDLAFIGACDHCNLGVYVQPGAAIATCPCGATYNVQQRRGWLLDAAQDVLGNATELSRALTGLGQPVTPSMIHGYAFRKRILQKGTDR